MSGQSRATIQYISDRGGPPVTSGPSDRAPAGAGPGGPGGDGMEARIAKLEATTEHIQSDVTDLKDAVARLDGKVDAIRESLGNKIDGVERDLRDKIDAVKDSLSSAKIWALILYISGVGSILGVAAKGFGWF